MKHALIPLLFSCLLLQGSTCFSQKPNNADFLIGVFDGRTPCQELATRLKQKVTSECIKIKWRLVLYKDSSNLDPASGTFRLEGFVFRGSNTLRGNWRITKGTQSDPKATVYHLENPLLGSLELQKADDNILFFLNEQKQLMVGNRDFSYTLNRVNKIL